MFEEPGESAHSCSSVIIIIIGIEHVNDYTLIRFEIRIQIVAADSIHDSIGTEISNSQVPTINVHHAFATLKVKRKLDLYSAPL